MNLTMPWKLFAGVMAAISIGSLAVVTSAGGKPSRSPPMSRCGPGRDCTVGRRKASIFADCVARRTAGGAVPETRSILR